MNHDPIMHFKKLDSQRKKNLQMVKTAAEKDVAILRIGATSQPQYATEIERLRAQRIEREKRERLRQNELIEKYYRARCVRRTHTSSKLLWRLNPGYIDIERS